jgi:2-polyprenyl-3-methyl-5-hydroxy-6-metoxy-1,4-benzoquinol methylase
MRDHYEAVWQGMPAGLEPADFALRKRFLLERVRRVGEQVGSSPRVLDVGCGEGRFTAELARAGAHVVGIDVAHEPLRRARARDAGLDLRIVEPEGPWQLDDASFDVVWAGEVIEHVADTAVWLSEVRRVLVPGGRLLVTTPSHGRVPLLVRGIDRFSEPLGDHLHLYTRRSLMRLLHEFGFGPVRVRAVGGVPVVWRASLWAEASR